MIATKHSLFLDENIAKACERAGYAVVDFLDANAVAELKDIYRRQASGISMGFRVSLFSTDIAYRKAVDKNIKEIFSGPLEKLLHRHKKVMATFLEKRPVPEQGEVPLHQDWTFVDEAQFQSLNCWCPLDDVDERNGCLWVLPGSHRFPTHPRAPFGPAPWIHWGQSLASELIPVPMKKGSVLIHDHRLWHASNANHTQTTRLATACVVVPEEAELFHFCCDEHAEAGGYDRFRVDDAFFCEYHPGHPPPDRYRCEKVAVKLPCFAPELLEQFATLVRTARLGRA